MINNYCLSSQYSMIDYLMESSASPAISTNATFYYPDSYYVFTTISSEPKGDREFIYDLYKNSKNFTEEEIRAEENIIKKNAIPLKNNIMDYYE